MSPRLLWLLTTAAAVTAANIYISQPLLEEIGHSFGQPPAHTGLVLTLTQLGYVAGLILLAPLGDVVEKRRLLLAMLGVDVLVTLAAGLTTNFAIFLVLAFVVGLTNVQAQIVFPYVAGHHNGNRNLGIVLSACLVGVLLSRTFSGLIGEHLGWRAVYFAMALGLSLLALVLYQTMPAAPPDEELSYSRLLASLYQLFLSRPQVRSIALTGALIYGSLTAFWASLAFYLQGPAFRLGPEAVGAFGLIGLAGAMASNLTGRYLDRLQVKQFLLALIAMMLLSYLVLLVSGPSIPTLVAAVILLDLGAQGASVSNQSEIYRLYSDARTRLNTIYKVVYFLGAALGSALSTWAWQHEGWAGVCLVGIAMLLLAGLNLKLQPAYEPALAA
ncbi:MAG: MFS transporter [Candidatus Eremiobacteraeota bacterium]|nr:MFS transporter [Candidatus Eremiobacteraeota bacterium]